MNKIVINTISKPKNLFKFSSANIPHIDVSKFLMQTPDFETECVRLVDALSKYGFAVIEDPRFHVGRKKQTFDLISEYFDYASTTYKEGQTHPGVFPDYRFQKGLIPQRVNKNKKAVVSLKKGEVIDFYSSI